MYSLTNSPRTRILLWLLWAIAFLAFAHLPPDPAELWQQPAGPACAPSGPVIRHFLLAEVASTTAERGSFFGWRPRWRWRKWAWRRYQALCRAHRRALWLARLARLALSGALSMAALVDLLTRAQLRRQMGALPVLYRLLELLQVRQIINRHCGRTRTEVDHGTVALVLMLNRLTAPRALCHVADWIATTVLVHVIGFPAGKFNDDRLARTLDALAPHARDIWLDIVHAALLRFEIDLSIIFYDLTAFVVHGEYADSQQASFGFAHNTPMNKKKIKMGVNASADGNIPLTADPWSGNTLDQKTVQTNMDRLCRLLKRRGWPVDQVLLIGDRAMLNDELALVYDDRGLRYLAGLEARKKVHRQLLLAVPEAQFYAHPLTAERGPAGYWGRLCAVPFQHGGRQVTHRGLVVLSGPMRTALRRSRAARLRELRRELEKVRARIGDPYYRTLKCVQARADTKLRNSPVGGLMRAQAYQDEQGQVCLRWWVDRYTLLQAMQRDGRYLLVTNDWRLSPAEMLAHYRDKDGLDQRFKVSKSDLKVSPIYLHKDERIQAMLLINMLALLTYSLLERQARRHGLTLTTRRIIQRLEELAVVETYCHDGSCLRRLTPVDDEQRALLAALAEIMADLDWPRFRPALSASPLRLPEGLPPPRPALLM